MKLACRLWNQSDTPNRRVMDKDRFRRDLENVENAYQQVLERVLAETAISGKTQADTLKARFTWCGRGK